MAIVLTLFWILKGSLIFPCDSLRLVLLAMRLKRRLEELWMPRPHTPKQGICVP